MKYLKILILTLILTFLTGCWNYRELEELGIVGGIGIDINDEEFNVSVEILNSKKVGNSGTNGGSSGEETSSIFYEASAKTVREALNLIVSESPKKLYLGHIHVLIISEEVAKEGLYKVIDFFVRDIESRKIFPMVVVKNAKASDVLKVEAPLENVVSANIQESLEKDKLINGITPDNSFDEILMSLYTNGRYPTISAIEVINMSEEGQSTENIKSSEPETKIKVIGSAIFKQDKLIGYLESDNAIGFSLIRNQITSMTVSFPCDDNGNYANIVVDDVKIDLKANIKDNKPVGTIEVTGEAALVEYNCKSNLLDIKVIDNIEEAANDQVEKMIKNTIEKTQTEFKSDIFGFGEYFYRNNYRYWQKNEKKWDEIFSEMQYKVKSKIELKRTGSIIDSSRKR